jgi:iron complex transport system substrate-binding protein
MDSRFPRPASLLLALAAAACSPAPEAPATNGAAPAGGPRRIVALTVGSVDTLVAMGELDRVVGVEEDCFIPGTEHLVKIRNDDHSGPSKALNVEAILALAPDAVIAKEDLRPALDQRGLRMVWVPTNTGYDSIPVVVERIGALVGRPDKARALNEDMARRRAAVEALVGPLPKVRVYYEAGRPGRTAGPGTVMGDMIVLAGGINIAGTLPMSNPQLSSEAIVAADPEVIILSPWSDSPEDVAKRPGWDRIAAVRDGRVHRVPEKERKVGYPSPSCLEGCERMLVPWLHPELAPASAGTQR